MLNKISEFFNFNVGGSWYTVGLTEEENNKLLVATLTENMQRARIICDKLKDVPDSVKTEVVTSVMEHIHYVKEKYARFKLEKDINKK